MPNLARLVSVLIRAFQSLISGSARRVFCETGAIDNLNMIDLLFITLNDGLLRVRISARSEDAVRFVLKLIFEAIGNPLIQDGDKWIGNLCCKKSKSTLEGIRSLNAQSYIDGEVIGMVCQFLSRLTDDEWFAIVPCRPDEIPSEEVAKNISFQLQARCCGCSADDIRAKHERMTKNLYKYYSPVAYHDCSRDECIGERDSDLLTCRFCGRTKREGASFNKIAHAISNALGNDSLFLAEECDECNGGFVNRLEMNVSHYFTGLRSMVSVPVKGGKLPSYRGDRVKIDCNEPGRVEVSILDPSIVKEEQLRDGVFRLSFPVGHGTFIPQDIYRLLVKFAVSCLPAFDRRVFRRTVDWVRTGDKAGNKLPLIAVSLCTARHPSIALWERKIGADGCMPRYLCRFSAVANVFLFEVPFVDYEEHTLMTEERWNTLFAMIPELREEKRWTFESYESEESEPASVMFAFEAPHSRIELTNGDSV